MKHFLIKVAINGVALWVAAFVVSGVSLAEDGATWQAKTVTVALVALVFGIVNALIKPIVKFFSFPAVLLSVGLFTFIINALMLELTAWLAKPLGLSFTIDKFFWSAVFAAVVVTLVSWVLSAVLPDGD